MFIVCFLSGWNLQNCDVKRPYRSSLHDLVLSFPLAPSHPFRSIFWVTNANWTRLLAREYLYVEERNHAKAQAERRT